MDALLGLLMVASSASLYVLVRMGFGRRAAAARERLWREAAAFVGLQRLESSGRGLEGWSGALRVRMTPLGPGGGTRVSVDLGLPADVSITPELDEPRLRGLRRLREVEIGDEEFDAAAWVLGPPALLRAVLDPDARHVLAWLLQRRLVRPRLAAFWARGWVRDGQLQVELPETSPPGRNTSDNGMPAAVQPADEATVAGGVLLPLALKEVLALARRLELPQDVAAQLADHLSSEPEGRVRLRGLQALLREYPHHPATARLLRAACEDPEAEVRLEAAVALGKEKREVLLQLAHGEGAEDAVTARAVAALDDALTLEQTESVLHGALRVRRPATAERCLALLGRHGGAGAISMLARVLAVETSELAVAAAEALARTGDASVIGPLLGALDHGEREVRLAATQALGRVGTAAEVQRLKQAETEDHALRTAARQAIAEIHSRLAGAEPGQLSLAGGQSGQLSIADEEQGRLSLSQAGPTVADHGARR